jgi:6-phospho-beta-glucosidase
MKVAIIGGGGARTPAIMYTFARHHKQVPLEQVVTYDIDEDRLHMMGAIADRIVQETGSPFRLVVSNDSEETIADADFVIVSIRVGGQAARAADERIALNHGYIGQETTGPAGLSYALRSIPVVQEYADMTSRLAPNAWLINFTNPSGLVTQALYDRSPVPIVGVCDSPQVIAHHIARAAGVPVDDLTWTYAGLNHLGWVTSVRYQGQEILPRIINDDTALSRMLEDDIIPPELVRHLGVVPNEYCYYYYYRDRALESQLAAEETRGEFLTRLDRSLQQGLATISSDDTDAIVERYGRYLQGREMSYLATERHGVRQLPQRTMRELILSEGEGYIGVAIKIMAALRGYGNETAVLNVPNHGAAIRGMDGDDIVEVTCEITPDGFRLIPSPPLLPESLALIRTIKTYERLTAEAALTGSRKLAIRALTHHPLVGSFPAAEKLVDAYLDKHQRYLPRFSKGQT